MVVGRATNLGKPTWSDVDFWPLNTTLYVADFKGNEPRWVYHLFESMDFTGFDSGSVQPMLNRNYIAKVRVRVPDRPLQRSIAEVLGALDDKIAANTRLAATAEELALSHYRRATDLVSFVPMNSKLTPILGGTPSRANSNLWGGDELWISAKDVTGAPSSIIVDTDEKITTLAVLSTKAKPLPRGSVILTARGTVGAVARLAEPASFNQSCYGFVPDELPAGALYFAIRAATERAKAMAHGSVFDTITIKTFAHLVVPDLDRDGFAQMESVLAPLLDREESAIRENRTLAATRDALLAALMSGRLTVRDAEATVEAVV